MCTGHSRSAVIRPESAASGAYPAPWRHPRRCTAAGPGDASSTPSGSRRGRPPPGCAPNLAARASTTPRSRRAEDAAAIAAGDEPGQIAAMIEVGVSQDDGVDGCRGDGEGVPVPQAQFLEALKQTAVDENPVPVHLEQMLGPGHGADGRRQLPFLLSITLFHRFSSSDYLRGDKKGHKRWRGNGVKRKRLPMPPNTRASAQRSQTCQLARRKTE